MSDKKQPPILEWIYGYTIARKSNGELSHWHFSEDKDRAFSFLEIFNDSEDYHIVRVRIIKPTEFYMEEVIDE